MLCGGGWLLKMTDMISLQSYVNLGRRTMRNLLHAMQLWTKTIDLLDVVLCASFSLITSGVYMLWGKGWSCITLGSLLLLLVVIGIPVKQKS
jgi:hypothetical protein